MNLPHQAHTYTAKAKQSSHVARGDGLHAATTGVPASFTIELVGDDGSPAWRPGYAKFLYVWIASEDQVVVERSGFGQRL